MLIPMAGLKKSNGIFGLSLVQTFWNLRSLAASTGGTLRTSGNVANGDLSSCSGVPYSGS
jgi:hypothetical protein